MLWTVFAKVGFSMASTFLYVHELVAFNRLGYDGIDFPLFTSVCSLQQAGSRSDIPSINIPADISMAQTSSLEE